MQFAFRAPPLINPARWGHARMTQRQQVGLADLIENQALNRFGIVLMIWASLAMFIEGFEMQLVGYAAPVMIKALHADKASFGLIFGANNFGYLLGALTLSSAGDRLGRRRMVIFGVLLFSVFTLCAAWATDLYTLAGLRFVAGIGLGGAVPNAIALTAEYAPRRSRAQRIAWLYVAYTIGGACTGLLASQLMPLFGWQVVFLVGGGVGLGLAVLLFLFLPESARFLALRQPGSAALRGILARMRPELELAPDAEILVQEEPARKVPMLALFQDGRTPITLLLWLSYITGIMALQFMTSWLPTLINGTGIAVSLAVLTGSLFHVGGTVGNVAIGRLLDRRGIIALAVGFAIAVPLVAFMGPGSTSIVLLMPLVLLCGFFIVGAQNGINAVAGTIYPTWMRSTGSGWTVGVGRIGSIIGPMVGGLLISLEMPISTLFLFVCVPVAVTAAALALLAHVATRAEKLPAVAPAE
jgi:AAHS family 4-hydroxybenzoate transporter-like MFS transporter